MLVNIRLVLCGAVLFFSMIICSSNPVFADPLISVQPSSSTIEAGQSLLLSVFISDVTDLYAFEFDIGFDPRFISASSITEGPFLSGGGETLFIPGAIDNFGGSITFTGNTLLGAVSGVSGSGELATVTFTALARGTSSITLFNVTLLDSDLSGTSSTATQGSVRVTAIPEPSTVLLLGSGLPFLLAFARRKSIIPNALSRFRSTRE